MDAALMTAPPRKHPVLPMPRSAVTSHSRPASELEYASAQPVTIELGHEGTRQPCLEGGCFREQKHAASQSP
jgi:hypothetical protein